MTMSRLLTLAFVVLCGPVVYAQETVGVSGSRTRFPVAIECKIGDENVKLALTGAAMRTKLFFNVYTIGGYVRPGGDIRTADALAGADSPKQLHLVMERDVDGKDMADAFRAAVRPEGHSGTNNDS